MMVASSWLFAKGKERGKGPDSRPVKDGASTGLKIGYIFRTQKPKIIKEKYDKNIIKICNSFSPSDIIQKMNR